MKQKFCSSRELVSRSYSRIYIYTQRYSQSSARERWEDRVAANHRPLFFLQVSIFYHIRCAGTTLTSKG